MPLDPSIPLAFKPTVAAESPIANVSRLMQMRGMASEVALRNAQTENIEAQAEGRRAEMNEQNIIRDAMKDPAIAKQIGGGDFSALNGKVSIGMLDKMTKSATDHHKDLATATQTDLENRNLALKSIYQSVNGLRSLKDPGSINQAIPGLLQQLTADGTFKTAKIDPAQIPTSVTSIDDLNQWLASTNLLQGANEAALATKTAEGAANAPYEKTVTTDKGIMGFNPQTHDYDRLIGQAPDRKANGATTVTTDKGIMQWNPKTDLYDIPVGGAPPKGGSDSAEQQFVDEYRKIHPGATIAQAQRAHKLNEHIAPEGDDDAKNQNKLLTPGEAATLQVPYGTTRAQAAGKMPATAGQNVVATYATRMKQSGDVLTGIGENIGAGERAYNALTPNFFNTAKGQQFDQAQRDFINATLRRESGAVISDSEFDNAYKQYIPRAGDSDKVLKQKRENREIQYGTFKRAAGNAYQDPGDLIKQAEGGAPAKPAASGTAATHTLNGHPIAIDPKTNTWIYTETGHPAQ